MTAWIRNSRNLLLAAGMSLIASTAQAEELDADAIECGEALQRGDFAASVAACTRAIDNGRLDGGSLAVAYNLRGTAHAALGQPGDAIADYDQAVALSPGYARAYFNRGVTHCDQGAVDQAVADIARQWELAPDEVAVDQRMLAESGFYTGGIDGSAGPGTQAALRAWVEGGCR